MKRFLFLMLFAAFTLEAAPYSQVENLYGEEVMTVRGASEDQDVMILAHGFGSDRSLINALHSYPQIKEHLVSFNFPDYGTQAVTKDPKETVFGSIDELIPLLSVMKKTVVDGAINKLSLYGFSAGGGAVVNAIAVLNSDKYPKELEKIGITPRVRKQILYALERGVIILDTPLKSVEEIIAFRGSTPQLEVIKECYRANHMRPIDAISQLHGLKLTVYIHFQKGDEVLSNRDDKLYIQRMKAVNVEGKTYAIIGDDGGHSAYHKSLWENFKRK